MNPTSHRAVTLAAVECLADLEPQNGSTRKRLMISGTDYAQLNNKKLLAVANSQTDGHAPEYDGKRYKDYDFRKELSFIDINGAGTGGSDGALDDPHVDKWFESPDKCEKSGLGSSFAAYNHFIDIGKGKGTYNDYDGYSYHNGSGSRNQYETLHDAVEYFTGDSFLNGINEIGKWVTDSYKVDEALAMYFNDSNVEYPGSKWYRNCSPALWNYSYPSEEYGDKYFEMKKRFPWGKYGTEAYRKNKGKCVPWSVFMPVDNLGRYWYETFLMSRKVWDLGPVLHAVQDACVPHHAAGHMGNYHAKFEKMLERFLHDKSDGVRSWSENEDLRKQAVELYKSFNRMDSKPKSLSYPEDLHGRTPSLSWSVDQIITWAAFGGYEAYDRVYYSFKSLDGIDDFRDWAAQRLFVYSLALSMLILKKAQIDATDLPRERKVESINIESIELSANKDILFGIFQSGMENMAGGSIEIGKRRDVPISLKKGSLTLDVSEYSIDAAYMLLSIKKPSSGKVTVKNIKVSYRTKDGKVHDYYKADNPISMVLNSVFQQVIPRTSAYSDGIKAGEYLDKIRIIIDLSDDKDAGSSGGLILRVDSAQGDKIVRNEYPLFKNGLTKGKRFQDIAYLLGARIRQKDLRNVELVNKTENAVNIIKCRAEFLDGYTNQVLMYRQFMGNIWLEPGKQDSLLIGRGKDLKW